MMMRFMLLYVADGVPEQALLELFNKKA
jgi:uncharacterized protein YdiU (UPF0061 family)